MKKQDLEKLNSELSSLVVFRELLQDEVISRLCNFLTAATLACDNAKSCYAEFVSKLYEKSNGDLTQYIRHICYYSENVYVKAVGEGVEVAGYIEECVKHELDVLCSVSQLTPNDLTSSLKWDGFLPSFKSDDSTDLCADYMDRVKNISKFGYGQYAFNHMFYIDDDGAVKAVKSPDTVTLSELVDYKSQQKAIIANTLALLGGKPAANILLTGDAGTGKSSTIKAVVNKYHTDGLRIIEVRKDQMRFIPKVLDELSHNPLKFILFIDDLSFLSDDDSFNSLKAVLEGSVSARSKNVVIYATSNRRHIIRENFSDREGDDIHRNDTMQEMVSLSNRFGLHITFSKPDKATYLHIVSSLAAQHGLNISEEKLTAGAERFALQRGGRSARLARQYIDFIISGS